MSINGQNVGKLFKNIDNNNIRIHEILNISIHQLRSLPKRYTHPNSNYINIIASIDNNDIYQTISTNFINSFSVHDEFTYETKQDFSYLRLTVMENSRIPKVIGYINISKHDILKYCGEERWFKIYNFTRNYSKYVSGKLCVDLYSLNSSILIKIIDYMGINIRNSNKLYLFITVQGFGKTKFKKLSIVPEKENKESISIENDCFMRNFDEKHRILTLALWEDVPSGSNSYFHGQVEIHLKDNVLKPKSAKPDPKWYRLKPSTSSNDELDGFVSNNNCDNSIEANHHLGEVQLRSLYMTDHVLSCKFYEPLLNCLLKSLNIRPFCCSSVGMIEYLPSANLTIMAKSLMKIFFRSNLIRQLLRILCSNDIVKCQDINTLFRSQSLASKIIHEQMKFIGHHYLLISLKPIVDMIYNEHKNCEIDPSKLSANDCIESNKWNLIVYGEIAFSQLVDSYYRCPLSLREMFFDLREVVLGYFPGREDIQRLALSSFIVMRFFAAAIMNPKMFGIKRENPDKVVSRTLVLVAKILQKLSNCVVSSNSISAKEPWLDTVLERFTDETHRLAMLKFLDRISLSDCEFSISRENTSIILLDGFFIERKAPRERKKIISKIYPKRRYVVLTENEISWQKSKDDEPKGRMELLEVSVIEPVKYEKNVFRISSPGCEIHFQAPSTIEMNEWIVQIQKQRKRQFMVVSRNEESSEVLDIDGERELEAVHVLFYANMEILTFWKNALETFEDQEDHSHLPSEILEQMETCSDPVEARKMLFTTINEILNSVLEIEQSHEQIISNLMKVNCDINENEDEYRLSSADENNYILKSRFKKISV